MALGAVLLLFRPVLTAILPGLGNVVERTRDVAKAADESFKQAAAAALKYEKALNAKKPIDASGARAGVAAYWQDRKAQSVQFLNKQKQVNNLIIVK